MREARSIAEARLYIARQPCRACGATGFAEPSRIVEHGERLCVACRGYCPKCGAERAFELALGEERVSPLALGNAAPSTLIDAGEWIELADEIGARVPGSAAGLDPAQRAAARAELVRAIAALEEVLKFYEPGATQPPPSAFFTETGRRVYRADGRRFARFRIDAVLEAWRALAADLASSA
jgi:hypothetical protein